MKITQVYDLSRKQWEYLIDQYIFDARNREIAKKRLLDKVGISDLAEEYYLSQERVKKIMAEVKDILLRHIISQDRVKTIMDEVKDILSRHLLSQDQVKIIVAEIKDTLLRRL